MESFGAWDLNGVNCFLLWSAASLKWSRPFWWSCESPLHVRVLFSGLQCKKLWPWRCQWAWIALPPTWRIQGLCGHNPNGKNKYIHVPFAFFVFAVSPLWCLCQNRLFSSNRPYYQQASLSLIRKHCLFSHQAQRLLFAHFAGQPLSWTCSVVQTGLTPTYQILRLGQWPLAADTEAPLVVVWHAPGRSSL